MKSPDPSLSTYSIKKSVHLSNHKLIKSIQIELYVAEYTDKTGWEREWALLEESASQVRVKLPDLLPELLPVLSYEELK